MNEYESFIQDGVDDEDMRQAVGLMLGRSRRYVEAIDIIEAIDETIESDTDCELMAYIRGGLACNTPNYEAIGREVIAAITAYYTDSVREDINELETEEADATCASECIDAQERAGQRRER